MANRELLKIYKFFTKNLLYTDSAGGGGGGGARSQRPPLSWQRQQVLWANLNADI